MNKEPWIPKHGGYRKLKTFQPAQWVYEVTVRFCDRYMDKRSRMHDQMVQAARSGVQYIAEGSQASSTSKKVELKLTTVAEALKWHGHPCPCFSWAGSPCHPYKICTKERQQR